MEARPLRKSDFTEVAIGDFISGTELPVDLFIQLSDTKFIQIAKAGNRVEIDRVVNYESKKVTHLLIKNTDYGKYLSQGLTIAGIVIKNKELPQAHRQSTLTKIAANVFAEIEQVGMKKEAFQHSKIIAGAAISLVSVKTDLFQMMEQFAAHSGTLYAHSVAVSTVSVIIGLGLNWKSVTIEKLALGGLLHDIGKRELPQALLKKSRAVMTPKDVMDYESHCYRGMQVLRSLPEIPDDVISIAYEHHENALGLGFPRKIKLMYINPLARVVGLADEFCNLTMKSPERVLPKTPIEAMHHIEMLMGQPFWPDAFNVLKQTILNGGKFEAKKSA